MPADLPIVLVPGLGSSVRNHLPILPTLWRHGSVFVANQTRDDTIAAMAARVLSEAPQKFSLIGHSLGGYIVLEMIRQAPERIARLALLNTSARPDTPEATKLRNERVAETKAGRYAEVRAASFPLSVHPDRVDDPALIEMSRLTGEDSGPDAYHPPADRDHRPHRLAPVSERHPRADAGAVGRQGHADLERVLEGDGGDDPGREARHRAELRPPRAGWSSRRRPLPRWMSGCARPL